ncbi:MAG TPA: hypothetical protein VGH16_03560 [Candidatus Binatia bacterium]|jgi:hypothetical protein
MPEPDVLPELERLPEPDVEPPEVEPEELPEPDMEPPEEPDVEPPRDRVESLVSVPTALWSPGMLLLEPESMRPVAAPPRSLLLLCELQPANANAPAISGITKIFLFIVTSSRSIVADDGRLATREDTLEG